MSPTEAVKKVASLTAQGLGPAASTVKTFPVTSLQRRSRAAPVIGLVPTFPVTAEA